MDEYLDILNKLFTPQQQTALFIITIGVMSLTQAFKNIYFGFFPTSSKPKKKAIIWLFAFIMGVAAGITGFYTALPPQPLWFWLFSGVISGGGSIFLYRLIVEVIWPRLGTMIKKP